jgi:isochorismate pyruvate lyase
MARSLPERERILAPLRAEIDAIDAAMVDLLAKRFDVVKRVIEVKHAENLAALMPERVEDVVERVSAAAARKGVPPELAERLWRGLIDWVVEYENGQLKGGQDGQD